MHSSGKSPGLANGDAAICRPFLFLDGCFWTVVFYILCLHMLDDY
ncbi:hypothetical protein B4099_3347 [Heyndrickxia coagulans]|uniref:Uncharacterized protein n=1 Tax=Heyndrickxia coagulans TaxID=1398 RepID=A0A150K803_HEYCO|nr:hypothetical protein B4099_3347 [Heyndrickxia coagulans]